MQRRDCLLDIAVINEKSLRRIDFARDDNFDAERMSVQSTALVAFRERGEPVRGFERECFDEPDMHGENCRGSRRSVARSKEKEPNHEGIMVRPCRDIA